MNRTKAITATILILILFGLGFWLFGRPEEKKETRKEEVVKVNLEAHKLLGFELKQMEGWQSEISEFQRLDENQGQFKLEFTNSKDKTEIELFQSVNIINPAANLTGFDPNIREKVLVDEFKELKKLGLVENREVGLVLVNQDSYFGNYTYNLIDLESEQVLDNKKSLFNVETGLFPAKNFDQTKYTLKTVITVKVKEPNDKDRLEQKEHAKQLILKLTRPNTPAVDLKYVAKDSNSPNLLNWPFGNSLNQQVNQKFAENHKALDIVPSSKYYQEDIVYQTTGLEVFYSTCSGLATSLVDTTGAKVIRLECAPQPDKPKIVFEYWHNQVNFVGQNQSVKPGQILGIMGNTGNSHGRHLHLVAMQNGQAIDLRINLQTMFDDHKKTNSSAELE